MCRCTVNLAYMNLNQCKIAKKFSDFKWILHIYALWMEASRSQGQECGSNLFHSWKIPRRGQGSWSRVHGSQGQKSPLLFTIKKRWPHRTTVSFLKKSLRPCRWEWLSAGLACLTWVLHQSGGEGIVVFALLPPWEDVLHLPSARWLCPSTEQPGAKPTHSRSSDMWPGRHQVSQ